MKFVSFALSLVLALGGCAPEIKPVSVGSDQSLPVTLRDLDYEYAAAKKANLAFYSPRFFKNAEGAYQVIAQLRKTQQHSTRLSNELQIFQHNISRAYATKKLVQQRMGPLIIRYLRLENQAIFRQYPEKFQELEKLMTDCMNLLELRQVDVQSWRQTHQVQFDRLRAGFEAKLKQIELLAQ